jgi:hypothetical protein
MSIDKVAHFIQKTPIDPASGWELNALTELATKSVPDIFFRDREILLKADQTRLWLRWFLEGLATPWLFVGDATKSKIHVYELVLKNIQSLYPDEDIHNKHALADGIAEHIYAEVERRRDVSRDFATPDKKQELIDAATPARCYLCGYAFSREAIDKLLKVKGRNPIQTPPIIDILRPRGLALRDMGIEIEHVVPVAVGGAGQNNLRLSCGWCNRHKGAKTSLYDASFSAARSACPIGPHVLYELPEPFWMIRLLAIHPRCQHPGGCAATTKTDELFVALRDWEGSPNFYCSVHDPIAMDRFVAPSQAAKIWADRIR